MRRKPSPFALVLLGLGTFLLVLAPMLAWYVEPRAAVNPVDIDTTAVYTGTGAYFDTAQIQTLFDKRITITQQVRGDVADSEHSGRAVWDVTTTVDTDKSLPAADPYDALEFFPNRWVTDRKTNQPVHCCQESPRFEGDAYLKFPFDVQKHAYRWWDNSLGEPITLAYRGTKKIQGYTGYRFTGTVPRRRSAPGWCPAASSTSPVAPRCWPRSGTPTTASSWSSTSAPAGCSTPRSVRAGRCAPRVPRTTRRCSWMPTSWPSPRPPRRTR